MAELDQINVDGVHYDFRDAKAYQKPQDGIPASDLTSAIQALLTKASTALQPQDLNTLNSDVASLKALIESDSNNVIDKFNEIVAFLNGISSSSSLSGIVSDIATQINAKYTKPASGIPSTDLAQGVQTSLNKANTAYQKPSPGIPKTDLAQAVQTTLSNADTDHTNVATLQEKVSTIEGKIPSAASATNQLVDEESLSEHYAKKDGAYEEMLAGSALNLVDTSGSPVLREFTFDTAGGTNDIGTGSALIKKMRGNTIVWNQSANNFVYYGGTGETTGDVHKFIADNDRGRVIITKESARNTPVKAGHKYYISIIGKVDTPARVISAGYSVNGVAMSPRFQNDVVFNTDTFKKWSTIVTCQQDGTYIFQFLVQADTYGEVALYYKKNSGQIIDLTQMFGAGNEPSTVEEFEKLFPMPYYDYNEGQLLSFNGNSIKTVGFNQWDEEWETSAINPQTGALVPTPGHIASKNFIKVLPTTNYFAKIYGDVMKYHILVVGYGANKEYTGWRIYTNNTIFTIPDNVSFIRFCTTGTPDYGSTYNHDICINLSWSGTKDGTYEPYQEHVHDISFYKTIKDGDGNLLFPNGLLSAGSVYDEVTATKATKRIGRQLVTGAIGNTITLVGCSTTATTYKCASDIGTLSSGVLTLTVAVTDAEVLFELATPIEVEYAEQNMAYQVNDYGTEQLLPENTSTPNTTPVMLDVTYGINAVDTIKNLPRNYLAQDDLDRLLSAMGSALGFTYTKTWNKTDKQWAFTVTKTATTTDENV